MGIKRGEDVPGEDYERKNGSVVKDLRGKEREKVEGERRLCG